jgi:hypothetical protein
VIRVTPYGAALDPVGLEALRITERFVEPVEEMGEAGGVTEIARVLQDNVRHHCVSVRSLWRNVSMQGPNAQEHLKTKPRPQLDDRRSLVHADSWLEAVAARPNEKELSYRWRERAFVTSMTCFINSSWSARRPVVSCQRLVRHGFALFGPNTAVDASGPSPLRRAAPRLTLLPERCEKKQRPNHRLRVRPVDAKHSAG